MSFGTQGTLMDTILINSPGERIDGFPPLSSFVLPGAPFICCTERCWQLFRFAGSRPEAVRSKGRVDKWPVRVIPIRVEPMLFEAGLARPVIHVAKLPPFDPNAGCVGGERKISPTVVKCWLNVYLPHV